MKMYDKALEEFTLALDREALDPVLWHDRADVYLVNYKRRTSLICECSD